MYFLLETCQHPGVLRILYFVSLLLDLIFIIVPIVLILMLLIDFSKAVIAGDDDKVKKSTKIVGKRIIYAVLVFATPWIVSLFLELMSYSGITTDYLTCMNRAKSGDFTYYDKLLEQEEAAYEEARQAKLAAMREENEKKKQNINANSSGSSIGQNTASGSTYEEAAEAMLDLARSQLNHVGGEKYIGSKGLHWCSAFVTWNLKNTTIDNVGTVYSIFSKEGNIGNYNIASSTAIVCYKHSNLDFYTSSFYDGNYTPKKGDIIYFWYKSNNGGRYWDGDINHVKSSSNYAIDHVGLVDYTKDGTVYTIEGNTGPGAPNNSKVGANSYDLTSDKILGYCSWYK